MQHFHKKNTRDNWLKMPIASGAYQHWLTDRQSLTLRLQQRFDVVNVKIVRLQFAKAFINEYKALAMAAREHVLIREVLLMGQEAPVVFAHSVIPKKSLRGSWLGLRRLGCQPLGAKLFAKPQIKRTALSYKKLSSRHPLFRQADQVMRTYLLKSAPDYLWARRSVFNFHQHKIMVTEVFFPEILISNAALQAIG